MASDEDKSPNLLTLSPEERRRLEIEEERKVASLASDIARRYDASRLGKLAIAGAGRAEKLDEATRRSMEKRLGGSFSDVRVVRGPFADRVTKRHRADAVTVGATGIILMRDTARTNPRSARGQAVLAHELTHVKQAQRGMHFALEQGASGHSHEQEASQVERSLMSDADKAAAGTSTGSDEQRAARREKIIERVLEKLDEASRDERDRLGLQDPMTAVPPGAVIESREQVQILLEEGGLRGRTVRGLSYPGLRMPRALLDDAQFEQVNLAGAELGEADLGRTRYARCDLRRARFESAVVLDALFEDSDLTEAALPGAHLERVQVLRGSLANVDLSGAHLVDVSVVEANLYGVRLPGATLVRCRFSDPRPNTAVELTRANLRGATLIDCELGGANLYRADLGGALLLRCNLEGASLTGAEATGTLLVGCRTLGADLPDVLRAQRNEAP